MSTRGGRSHWMVNAYRRRSLFSPKQAKPNLGSSIRPSKKQRNENLCPNPEKTPEPQVVYADVHKSGSPKEGSETLGHAGYIEVPVEVLLGTSPLEKVSKSNLDKSENVEKVALDDAEGSVSDHSKASNVDGTFKKKVPDIIKINAKRPEAEGASQLHKPLETRRETPDSESTEEALSGSGANSDIEAIYVVSDPLLADEDDHDEDDFNQETLESEIEVDIQSLEIVLYPLVENQLYTFLNGSSDGKVVLHYYQRNGKLSNSMRKKAVDLVMRFELSSNPNKKIGTNDFLKLAKEFVELFPSEFESTYYMGFRIVGGKKSNAKGKLWDKYNNLKRDYRNGGIIPKKQAIPDKPKKTFSTESSISEAELEKDFDYLHRFPGPKSVVLRKWERTGPVRLAKFQSSQQTIEDYIAEYRPLGVVEGISELIDIDFNLKYPGHQDNLHNLLPKLWKEVTCLAKIKFAEDRTFRDNVSKANITLKFDKEDYVLCFLLLALMVPLPPAGRKRKSQDNETETLWRPSKLEAKTCFIFHVKSPNCLKTDVDARVEELRKEGHRFVSFVVVSGIDNKFQHYVYFNDTLYPTSSVSHSVDLCFKFFTVFDSQYPTESAYIWKFIQSYIYKIPAEEELPSLLTLAGDLKLL